LALGALFATALWRWARGPFIFALGARAFYFGALFWRIILALNARDLLL
jgi:hypothetical protein